MFCEYLSSLQNPCLDYVRHKTVQSILSYNNYFGWTLQGWQCLFWESIQEYWLFSLHSAVMIIYIRNEAGNHAELSLTAHCWPNWILSCQYWLISTLGLRRRTRGLLFWVGKWATSAVTKSKLKVSFLVQTKLRRWRVDHRNWTELLVFFGRFYRKCNTTLFCIFCHVRFIYSSPVYWDTILFLKYFILSFAFYLLFISGFYLFLTRAWHPRGRRNSTDTKQAETFENIATNIWLHHVNGLAFPCAERSYHDETLKRFMIHLSGILENYYNQVFSDCIPCSFLSEMLFFWICSRLACSVHWVHLSTREVRKARVWFAVTHYFESEITAQVTYIKNQNTSYKLDF